MLTVADALTLQAFIGARAVAGQRGLSRAIAWVHNSGVQDAARWLNGGELVLTTPANIPPTENGRLRYLHDLIDKRVAALAVAVGEELDHIPEAMCRVADAHDFPLIEIPFEARFVDVARAANERIAAENLDMLQRALEIHQRLTRLVLEGGGLKQLAETLARLINQSISIEDAGFQAFASVNLAAVDEARRYTQQYGRTDPRLVNALDDEILPQIRATLRPVSIPPMPHVGLEMERILAPIVVQGAIYGYLWIIADDRPLNNLDHLAIESGATVAALIMLHEDAVQSAEASLKGNLLTRLVQGEMSGANVLTDQALRYNVDLRKPFRVLLVEYPQATSRRLLRLYRDVNEYMMSQHRAVIVGQYAGQIMMLAQNTEDTETLVEDFRAQTSREGKARIGISSEHAGAINVRDAYKECREVLNITRQLGEHGPTLYFENLGYLHALFHAGPQALKSNPHVPGMRRLLEEQGADLFHTLEVYLDAGGNGVATAELLHIHRSTLNYRLGRISEIMGADLSSPKTRMDLQVALKLLRLFELAG